MSPGNRVGDFDRATVAVIGLGSVGGVIAGLLSALDRHDVLACVRHPVERLTVEQSDGAIEVPIKALTDPSKAEPRDWVLLCTKAYDTPSIAPWLQGLCGPHTRVAVLQNGIGHVDRLAPLVGDATIVPTIVYYNGERLAPDRVRFRRAGEYDFAVSEDPDGQAFAELLEGTPMRVLRSPDFNTLAWRKLLINAVANPITALTLRRQAVAERVEHGLQLVHALTVAALWRLPRPPPLSGAHVGARGAGNDPGRKDPEQPSRWGGGDHSGIVLPVVMPVKMPVTMPKRCRPGSEGKLELRRPRRLCQYLAQSAVGRRWIGPKRSQMGFQR
jgi:hypothetical protein